MTNRNEIFERWPMLWALGAYCIRDSGGFTPRPAPMFAIPEKYRRSVDEAGRLAASLTTILPDREACEEFLIGEEQDQIRLARRYGLGVLSRVLGHLFDGDLRGTYVDVARDGGPAREILAPANLW